MNEAGRSPPESAAAMGRTWFVDASLSVYLDVVRVLAAFAVLVAHVDQDGLYGAWIPLVAFSHEAVVVFFVLSGLVIAHSTLARQAGWAHYVVARAARVLSVVVPAIVLSFAVKGFAAFLDPGALAHEFLAEDLRIENVLTSMLFLNESWSLAGDLPWNGPYWSICYEVWYYVLFGLALYAPAPWRFVLLALGALVAGPAILLLFPLWLLGLWLARHGHRFVPGEKGGAVLWLISTALLVVLGTSDIDVEVRAFLHAHVPGFWRLESAQRFVTDYLLGLLVAVNFLAFRGMGPLVGGTMRRVAGPVALVSGFTFSLYLYHRPMTQFAGHFFPNTDSDLVRSVVAIVAIVGACVVLGALTERRSPALRRVLARWLARRATHGAQV